MRISLLSIGTELLNGRTVNTNATFLGEHLNRKPFNIIRNLIVPDTPDAIRKALDYCFDDSDMVITTGGLGPTNDDISKNVISEYTGHKLVKNISEFHRLEKLFASRSRTLNEANLSQVLYPKAAKIFVNEIGTASSFMVKKETKSIIALPGVPHEMKYLFTKKVLPYLLKDLSFDQNYHIYVFRLINIPESFIYEQIKDIIDSSPNLDFAFYPDYMLVDLVIKGYSNELENKKTEIRKRFAENIYSEDKNLSIDMVIAKELKKRKQFLAAAESCTGGLFSAMITKNPGASSFFKGSVISYSNEIKEQELSVKHITLENFGAVSEETVREMAGNILIKYKVDYSIAISGIAGPDGGSNEKPVGTVTFAIADKDGIISKTKMMGNERSMIQKRSSQYAFYLLWEKVNSK